MRNFIHTHTRSVGEAMCGVAANLNLRASLHFHETTSRRTPLAGLAGGHGAQKVNPSCMDGGG